LSIFALGTGTYKSTNSDIKISSSLSYFLFDLVGTENEADVSLCPLLNLLLLVRFLCSRSSRFFSWSYSCLFTISSCFWTVSLLFYISFL